MKRDYADEATKEKDGDGVMNALETKETIVQELAARVVPVPLMTNKQTCYEALRAFQSNPEVSCIIVCDKQGQPIGLLRRDLFFLKLNGFGGLDTWQKESIAKLMNKSPIVADLESTMDLLIAALAIGTGLHGKGADYVIAIKGNGIMGVLAASHLLN
ncbi:hypothetical protein [Paenibacillus luteus]|uniref:hypothetical protein n=1 Tax=Paenibacillus luteus TaxID=2545753 RepID=UPI0011417393|nr:hypothetical protein [Paenibacillus luteus]